jgi:4-diphosphocytidyl-2-C-methyl-D-erythritol kinase
VIVKPDVHVSTADAFAGIVPKLSDINLDEVLKTPVTEWKKFLKNDFEETVFKKHPVIRDLKQTLYAMGAEYASMSGSGSAVFGLFDKPVDLREEFSQASLFQKLI